MSQIRVFLIAPSLEIVGGQAVQAAHLLSALRKEPSLKLFFQPINPTFPRLLAPLKKIKFVRTIANWVLYVTLLVTRMWRYDVVHAFTAAYSSYLLWAFTALVIAKLYGKPIVLNYRDGQAEDHLRNWRTAVPTIRMMDAVVTPSGFLVAVFAKFGIQAQSISNILDVGHLRYRRRSRLQPLFLHNRSLETLYNVPCSLRAFQAVQQRYPDAALTIAHDGPLRAELERLSAELGLKNVRFVGAVPHSIIGELYDSADIYFTSPNVDNMPGSILECFASGLPVVATNTGGIPYIATNEETALLVPRDDDRAMAQAALRLLEDPELVERLTANAYASCSRYTEGPVREQWTALYRKLTHA